MKPYLSLVSGDGTSLVNWVTNNIDDSTQSLSAHGDHDGGTSVYNLKLSNIKQNF